MLVDFTKEKYDIVVMAGQSNGYGFGLGKVTEPYEAFDKVWYLDEDFTVFMAREEGHGNFVRSDLSLIFAREYVKSGRLVEGRKLLIVRASPGNRENMGGGFLNRCWGPGDFMRERMFRQTETALALNPENRIVAFLWQQGETDSIKQASYETHYGNLLRLIIDFMKAFPNQKFPFLAGNMVPQWIGNNMDITAPVVRAIKDVCAAVGGRFVESEGLTSNYQVLDATDDTIHFSREGIYGLGERYFKLFDSL